MNQLMSGLTINGRKHLSFCIFRIYIIYVCGEYNARSVVPIDHVYLRVLNVFGKNKEKEVWPEWATENALINAFFY